MAATDEFPRGWTLSAVAGNPNTASVTVPAVAGVSHVLDSLYAKLISEGGGGGTFAPSITVTVSGILVLTVFLVVGVTVGVDDFQGSDLGLTTTPGNSIVVTFTQPCVATTIEELVIQGHDL